MDDGHGFYLQGSGSTPQFLETSEPQHTGHENKDKVSQV